MVKISAFLQLSSIHLFLHMCVCTTRIHTQKSIDWPLIQVWIWRETKEGDQLRWMNTVLWAVSSNLCYGMCFKLDKQTWRQKSNGTQKTISQNLLIKILWYLAEVAQTNFVTHLIITVPLYYWLSKIPSGKIWSNKFQMVMINYNKLCASL